MPTGNFPHVDADVLQRVKDANAEAGRRGLGRASISATVVSALQTLLPELEQEYNGGQPFSPPERTRHGIKTGGPQGDVNTTRLSVSGIDDELAGRIKGAIDRAETLGRPLRDRIATQSQLVTAALEARLPALTAALRDAPGRAAPGPQTTAIEFMYVDAALAGRAYGAIWIARGYGPLLGWITTMSDLVNCALEGLLPALEKQYNRGKPFTDPGQLSRGRKRGWHPEPDAGDTTRIRINAVRSELAGRARGAIDHVETAGPLLGRITTISQLLDVAFEGLLPQLERLHHDGEPFPTPAITPQSF